MKATVTYNEDGEPTDIRVTQDHFPATNFEMHGSTAVAKKSTPAKGDSKVYLNEISECMDYVESLPFVQAVTIDPEDPDDE